MKDTAHTQHVTLSACEHLANSHRAARPSPPWARVVVSKPKALHTCMTKLSSFGSPRALEARTSKWKASPEAMRQGSLDLLRRVQATRQQPPTRCPANTFRMRPCQQLDHDSRCNALQRRTGVRAPKATSQESRPPNEANMQTPRGATRGVQEVWATVGHVADPPRGARKAELMLRQPSAESTMPKAETHPSRQPACRLS
jgi:hypothetical protein